MGLERGMGEVKRVMPKASTTRKAKRITRYNPTFWN
jgi:hypothetical protein